MDAAGRRSGVRPRHAASRERTPGTGTVRRPATGGRHTGG